jgi:hypothetical protein
MDNDNFKRQLENFRRQLKSVEYILEKKEVSPNVLAKLPPKHKVMSFHMSTDMDGNKYEAMMVQFHDKCNGLRIANFRLSNGEYVDDFIL